MSNVDKVCGLLVKLGVDQFMVTGDHIRCRCPIHDGDNPTSLAINYENGLYFCHSNCSPENRSGNLVKLVKLATGCSTEEAGLLLSGIEFDPSSMVRPTKPVVPLGQDEINQFFERTVSCEKYRGWKNGVLQEFSVRRGVDFPFTDRVWFPLHDLEGRIVGYKGRATGTVVSGNKYIFFPRGVPKSQLVFNYHRVHDCKQVFICEGEFDTINMYRNGYPSVAIMSSKPSRVQLDILSQFDGVVLFLDNDEAGHECCDKMLEALDNVSGVVFPPPFRDPGDLTQEELYYIVGGYTDCER